MESIKYKCIKEFKLPIYDENDCLTDNYGVVHKGSIYEYSDSYIGESDIRMYLKDGDDDFGYIDITFETLEECFKRMTENKKPTPEEIAEANKKALEQFLKDNPLYECDSEKNINCKKTGCYTIGGPCHCTSHEEYARRDLLGYAIKGKIDEEQKRRGNQIIKRYPEHDT